MISDKRIQQLIGLIGRVSALEIHAGSTGSDHTYIDQSVVSGSSPVFDGDNFTGIPDKAMETDYVEVAGDRMTGDLEIYGTLPAILLNESDSTDANDLWRISANNDNLYFQFWDDSGSAYSTWLQIFADGEINLVGPMKISNTSPYIDLDETDTADPDDLWRIRMNAGDLIFSFWDNSASAMTYTMTLADGGLMSWTGYALQLKHSAPAIYLSETDATDPDDNWRIIATANNFKISHRDDSASVTNSALQITPARAVDWWSNYFDINQLADDAGLRIYGYDDKSAVKLAASIDSSGDAFIQADQKLWLKALAGNLSNQVESGYHVLTRLGDTAGASKAVWYDSGWNSVAEITSDGDIARKGFFCRYEAGGGQTIGTSWTTVGLDTDCGFSDSAHYSFASSVVTVTKAGNYRITYDVTARNSDAATRRMAEWKLERDPLGVGSYADLPGSLRYSYHRIASIGYTSASCTILVQLTAGDIIRLRGKSGSATTVVNVADGCVLTIEKIG